MDKALAKRLGKTELWQHIQALEKELQSHRVVIAIQREFITKLTGRDVDADLDRERDKQ